MALADLLETLRACRWVDLTHAFGPGIPHYAGFPDEERVELFSHERDGFLAHSYRHIGQWGTHMDPPAHFAAGGRTQDEVPVTDMILPLVVLDVRAQADADHDFVAGPEVVETFESAHGRILTGSFVALHTGWGQRWPDDAAMQNRDADGVPHYPGWDPKTLRLLVDERGVTAIGHDTTDTDRGIAVADGSLPAEAYVLRADRWQIELLANLDQVPVAGALIVATWPKPLRGSGFPARAFAIVDDR